MSGAKESGLLTVALKAAVTGSGRSLYRIAADTGLQKPSLIRFMRGQTSLRLDKADVLAGYLGLVLAKKRQPE